jgi:hypothetical protein
VDPRAGLHDVEKRKFLTLPELELRPLSRPARSQSLNRMRYPGSTSRLRTCSPRSSRHIKEEIQVDKYCDATKTGSSPDDWIY